MSIDVLLFDTNLATRHLLADALSGLGIRVKSAPTQTEVVQSFGARRYDAVLLSMLTSTSDPWPLVRLFRSGRCGFAQTPIFIVAPDSESSILLPRLDRSTSLLSGDNPTVIANQLLHSLKNQPRPSILLIEDEELAAKTAERALEKYFTVDTARDGVTGLGLWREKKHDLIVLDMMLPGMSGREVLAVIRTEDTQQLVLILTSLDSPEHHQELILEGADDYMVKNPHLFDLATRCDSLLFEKRLRNHAANLHVMRASTETAAARLRMAQRHIGAGQPSTASHEVAHAIIALGCPPANDNDL